MTSEDSISKPVLAYTVIDSPVGEILIAATNSGVCRVAFHVEDFDAIVDQWSGSFVVTYNPANVTLSAASQQFAQYFSGQRHMFDLELDERFCPAENTIYRQVQNLLSAVPYGATVSYSHLAKLLGRPGASRAVGTGCARNPIPIVIPCHRIVRANGELGAYLGGTEVKAYLLELEQNYAALSA